MNAINQYGLDQAKRHLAWAQEMARYWFNLRGLGEDARATCRLALDYVERFTGSVAYWQNEIAMEGRAA